MKVHKRNATTPRAECSPNQLTTGAASFKRVLGSMPAATEHANNHKDEQRHKKRYSYDEHVGTWHIRVTGLIRRVIVQKSITTARPVARATRAQKEAVAWGLRKS